ncbi:MAG: LacI family transcriptional regulator [Spirochaetales bacterium]|nr:LacI family transcriptional regulator [Spirochaetales bacterium]
MSSSSSKPGAQRPYLRDETETETDESVRGPEDARRATVRDIAAAAGVSIGTVSRYLNGYTLMPQTRARVEKGIEQTAYRDQQSVSQVRPRVKPIVGAIFPNFDSFHAGMLSAIEKVLYRNNYHVLTAGYESDVLTMREKFTFLREQHPEGIICSPVNATFGVIRAVERSGIPVVTYNDRVEAWRNDHVSTDDRYAAARAVEYLIDMNHTRIAVVAGKRDSSTGWDRLQGYYDALRGAGIPERPQYVRGGDDWGQLGSTQWARELLSIPDPPTAIFASNYVLADGVLRYCRDHGIRIPDDLSIVSFDDTHAFQLHSPPITVIRQPIDRIAEEAAALLFRRIGGDWESYPTLRTVRSEMILRESVRKLG